MKFNRGGAALAVAIAILAVSPGFARPAGGIIVERNLAATMRDGAALEAPEINLKTRTILPGAKLDIEFF